jgi:hypothetical protein
MWDWLGMEELVHNMHLKIGGVGRKSNVNLIGH